MVSIWQLAIGHVGAFTPEKLANATNQTPVYSRRPWQHTHSLRGKPDGKHLLAHHCLGLKLPKHVILAYVESVIL